MLGSNIIKFISAQNLEMYSFLASCWNGKNIIYSSEKERLLNKGLFFSKWERDKDTSKGSSGKTFGGPGMSSRNAFACMWEKTQFLVAHITKGQGGRQLLELAQQLDSVQVSFAVYLLPFSH